MKNGVSEKNKSPLSKRGAVVLLAALILLQTVLFIVAGIRKSYIHMDEGYSYGLSNYHSVEIKTNPDFYDTWHDKTYFEDYLALQDDERSDYLPVYENQKNDVHPPLYYLLLRLAMNFEDGHFSKWPGIILNIILYVFITVFVYLISAQLFADWKNPRLKAAILAFVSSITLASLTNAIYIRMYALSTLNVLITSYLHLKLREKFETRTLILISFSALAGSLTHYYYLFFLATLFIMTVIRYLVERERKHALLYLLAIIIAAVFSIAIFPFSVKHIFFG